MVDGGKLSYEDRQVTVVDANEEKRKLVSCRAFLAVSAFFLFDRSEADHPLISLPLPLPSHLSSQPATKSPPPNLLPVPPDRSSPPQEQTPPLPPPTSKPKRSTAPRPTRSSTTKRRSSTSKRVSEVVRSGRAIHGKTSIGRGSRGTSIGSILGLSGTSESLPLRSEDRFRSP
jgi:hypothetical protein